MTFPLIREVTILNIPPVPIFKLAESVELVPEETSNVPNTLIEYSFSDTKFPSPKLKLLVLST